MVPAALKVRSGSSTRGANFFPKIRALAVLFDSVIGCAHPAVCAFTDLLDDRHRNFPKLFFSSAMFGERAQWLLDPARKIAGTQSGRMALYIRLSAPLSPRGELASEPAAAASPGRSGFSMTVA